MLMGVPNLSPVDAAVATASYLEFTHNQQHGARAYVPGREDPIPINLADLRDWAPSWAGSRTGCARRGASRCTTPRRCCST